MTVNETNGDELEKTFYPQSKTRGLDIDPLSRSAYSENKVLKRTGAFRSQKCSQLFNKPNTSETSIIFEMTFLALREQVVLPHKRCYFLPDELNHNRKKYGGNKAATNATFIVDLANKRVTFESSLHYHTLRSVPEE